MVAVPLPLTSLAAPVANSGTVALGYPAGKAQADFTGANASTAGQVAVNDNDIYEQADDEVDFTYGASTITVTNLSGQTWPAGAKLRVQAAYTAASGSGGSGTSLTAASLVAAMAEAAADGALGPQMGEQIDISLATRTDTERREALRARGALTLAADADPDDGDFTGFDADGEAQVVDFAGEPFDPAVLVVSSHSAAYPIVATDAGSVLLHPSADTKPLTFTIPANAAVPFAIGTVLTFVNQASAGALTIAITLDTMRLAGAESTGSRTLAANGVATAIKLTSTEWIISGTGLT